MSNFWEIEKNVAMPVVARKSKKSKYPFREMEVGDSVFFPDTTTAGKETAYAHNLTRKTGLRFRTNAENGGVRIWRVE